MPKRFLVRLYISKVFFFATMLLAAWEISAP